MKNFWIRLAITIALWLVYPLCVALFGSTNLTAMISLPALVAAFVMAYYAFKVLDAEIQA